MAEQTGRLAQFNEQAQRFNEEAQHRAGEVYHETEELVRRNPGSSALVTLAVGVGVGLVLAAMLAPPPRRRSWYQSHMPDRHDMYDAVSSMLPHSISRYMS